MIETKLYKPIPPKPKRKRAKFRLNLIFWDKAFDLINLSSILKQESCRQLFPASLKEEDHPMVVYSLKDTIRSNIFNYNKFVSSLDFDSILADINSVPCFCHNFNTRFIDQHHKHVLTGDLTIVENSSLIKLMSKGPKYRIPNPISLEQAEMCIYSSLTEFIAKISTSKNINLNASDFTPWKEEVMRVTNSKIDSLKNKVHVSQVFDILEDGSSAKKRLDDLHSKFVFCPTDKAGNNVSIICKRLYAKIILDELGLNSENSTYVRIIDRNEEEIVQSHFDFQYKFGLDLPVEMQRLPPMHWIPKNHKNPTSSRFIIGSKMSSLKPLGKTITSIFKVIFKMKKAYFKKLGYLSGLKRFWPIDSHDEVVSVLDIISSKDKATSISTFDFSTLYTKIPHDKLVDVLHLTAKSVFNDTNRKNMAVSAGRAYFVKRFSSKFKYSVDDVHECCDFLINNAYFRVGNALFRQVIGIPMGSDPAPFFANLFLAHYESNWIKSLSSSDYSRAKRFSHVFRYIDDLVSINDNGEFARSFNEIYPTELVLNKENEDSNLSASYLDLNISISDNKFNYELYDKRNAFHFPIVRFPFASSNMPSKMFYATISTEILRISRASSKYSTFLKHCSPFITRMRKQGANNNRMKGSVNRLLSKHHLAFRKFDMDRKGIVDQLFP